MGNGMDKPVYVYCIVKKAILRKRDGSVVCSIPFSNQFRVLCECDNGRLYGEAYQPKGKGYVKYRGFVSAKGFCKYPVIDMSNLYYRNITGQKIPTTMRYGTAATGWIEADEKVNVIAYVNGWMLTGKGWTKADWLQKVREINDFENLKTLVYAVITQTVKDYTAIIHKIQTSGRFVGREYSDAVAEIRMIRNWFGDGDYLKIFEDDVTGEERLAMLDKELGVTDEWMKRVMSKRQVRKP